MNLTDLKKKGFKIVTNWQECNKNSIFLFDSKNQSKFIKYINLAKKKKCNFPLRLFHGLKDDVVPIKYSYLLSKTLVSKDCLIMLQNDGDHSLSSKDDLKRIGRVLIEIIKRKN